MTATVPPLPSNKGLVQVRDPTSPYNNYYAYIANPNGYGGQRIQFTADLASFSTFNVDSSNHLDTGSLTGEQESSGEPDTPAYNPLFMCDAGLLAQFEPGYPQPSCFVSPTGGLTCSQAPKDTRSFLQICYNGTPILVLDAGVDSGCSLALLTVIPHT